MVTKRTRIDNVCLVTLLVSTGISIMYALSLLLYVYLACFHTEGLIISWAVVSVCREYLSHQSLMHCQGGSNFNDNELSFVLCAKWM